MSTPINQKIHRRKIEGFNFFLVLFVRESLEYIWDLCLLKKNICTIIAVFLFLL